MSATRLATSVSSAADEWRSPGPPRAGNPRALFWANPARHEPLDYSQPKVPTTLQLDELRRLHCRHCPFCKHHGSVQSACYASWLFHSLEYGWKAHPVTPPRDRSFDNYDSIEEHFDEVCADFDTLESLGVLGPPLVSAPASTVPLQVVTRPRDRMRHRELGVPLKVRICLDCSRNLNDHLPDWKFRYDAADHVCSLLSPGDWLSVIDISKYYLRLPVHPSSRKFFTVRDPRDGSYRQYHRVPFGHKNAPAFASLFSAELSCILRHELGIDVSAYIDDFLFVSSSAAEGDRHIQEALAIFDAIGLPVSTKKVLPPSQSQKYLGLIYDTVKEEVRIASDGHAFIHLRQRVDQWLDGAPLTHSQLRSACGQMSWIAYCMTGARPYMRRWWRALKTFPRRGRHSLPPSVLHDAAWWRRRLHDDAWRGSRIWFPEHAVPVFVMKSDASGELGWGYHFGSSYDFGDWSSRQLSYSILYKELFPVIEAASRHGQDWSGSLIRVGLDNTGAVYALNTGSTTDVPAQGLLRRLADLSDRHQFDIVASWVPREHNVTSDILSRLAGAPHLRALLPHDFKRIRPGPACPLTCLGKFVLSATPGSSL